MGPFLLQIYIVAVIQIKLIAMQVWSKNTLRALIICHDNDEAGNNMLRKWQRLYNHSIAYPTPIGKDIGDAIREGFNIRSWLLSVIN